MMTEITIPKIGYTMEEATLTIWLKNEGDRVEQGEAVAEIESDKATTAIESPVSGWLSKRLHNEGDIVPVNACIALIGEADDAMPGEAPSEAVPSPAKPASLPEAGAARLSPRARKFAAERGVDTADPALQGTGVRGIVTERDIRRLQEEKPRQPAAPAASTRAAAPYRKVAAERLTASAREIPQFVVGVDADATALLCLKEALSGGPGGKVGLTALLVKCAARALRENPNVNASWNNGNITVFDRISVCVAVATQRGLAAPVLHDADAKGVFAIQAGIAGLAQNAAEGTLSPEELTGGTFTVSNLGMYGVDSFEAIVNPPQSAILAAGSAVRRAVVLETGEIAVRPVIRLNLTCDHRALDGADAAHFLGCIKRYVEKPELLIG